MDLHLYDTERHDTTHYDIPLLKGDHFSLQDIIGIIKFFANQN